MSGEVEIFLETAVAQAAVAAHQAYVDVRSPYWK